MTSSFVTHCASSTISPIAETKTESSIEESKAGETTESVIERSFVIISKQGASDSEEKQDDEVASVLLSSSAATTEKQESGINNSRFHINVRGKTKLGAILLRRPHWGSVSSKYPPLPGWVQICQKS